MYENRDISRVIRQHFPFVTDVQIEMFERLPSLYEEWNEKINVVSRKDIENMLGEHIFLDLAVKVSKNWRENPTQLKRFGFKEL